MLDLLNLYCHGYVATPIIEAFRQHGLFDLLGTGKFRRRDWLIRRARANAGYLTVALHALDSLGWLEKHPSDDAWRVTARAHAEVFDLDLTALYAVEPARLLRGPAHANRLANRIEKLLARHDANGAPLAATLAYGAVVPPLITALQSQTDADSPKPFDVTLDSLPPRLAQAVRMLFLRRDWLDAGGALTPTGESLLRTRVFSIAVSYRPMLHSMPELLFGAHTRVYRRNRAGEETHVDRRLNVIGSGLQHESYFKDVRRRIVEIFDAEPLARQPHAVVDVGCGDGSLLAQIHRTICEETLRGKHLHEMPLRLVGVDYNRRALAETARTLAGIAHDTLHGDINRPADLAAALASIGISPDQRVLHVRSFLDHNIHVDAAQPLNAALRTLAAGEPEGFLDAEGRLVTAEAVLSRWQQHLAAWAGCIHDSDLLILEAHALPAPLIRQELASSENFYFDTIHRLSHQYLISAEAFVALAASVGLFNDAPPLRYPKLAGFCRITLHHLRRRPYVVRHATRGDLAALYRLERLCWPAALRTPQREIRARLERYPQGQFV
ncbi:MAG TPA: polyketide synthase, partial [Thermoanaerobaculia bacterium]|nr:polyketide synthase [Thermoanaerobaculia bacterium]